MIQHVCLGRKNQQPGQEFDWRKPVELLMRGKDYKTFKKTIKVLFDHRSVKLIKKAKAMLE